MNYLGHLLITYPHRDLTMGNLLGDMMRRVEMKTLSPGLQQGFALHHDIDKETDQHPGVKSLITLLRPNHAKYAPVVVDILMDHILAHQWETHATLSYNEFTDWVYDLIPEYLPQLTPQVAARLDGMVYHRWIDGYDSVKKLEQVLKRMDRRAKFPSQFVIGIEDIEEHYDAFATTFEEFYPEIREKLMTGISV